MKRSRLMLLLAVLMAVVLTMSACGKKTLPKEAMENAWAASMEMKSFTFDGSFVINGLDLSAGGHDMGVLPLDPDTLRNLTIDFRGTYTRNPLRMEMILKLTIPGDLALSIELPIIRTEDKVYVRIPDIPFFPLGDAAGKFIELDPAQTAGEQAGVFPFDVDVQRKLAGDVMAIVFRHLDEGDFFREAKKTDVPGLPGDLKADRYIRFAITEENFDAFMTALVEKIAPEIIDLLLENEAYRSALQISEDDLRKAKEELGSTDPDSLRNELEALKESLNIREISMTGALKGDYLVYQAVKGNAEVAENGRTSMIDFTFDIRYDNINKDVTFEHGIPAEAITWEEFQRSLFAGLAF
jgi:hypothetical protein